MREETCPADSRIWVSASLSSFIARHLAHEINVAAQTVELIGQERRHFHLVDLGLNDVQPFEQVLPLARLRFVEQFPLQNQQGPIPAIDSRLVPPAIEMGQAAQDRN